MAVSKKTFRYMGALRVCLESLPKKLVNGGF